MRQRRLILFAHYDRQGEVAEYVFYYLKALKSVADRLVFISSAGCSPQILQPVEGICDQVLTKTNEGYDFGSWRYGFEKNPDWKDFDEIVLCNDSVYGPIHDLKMIFEAMAPKQCDFWGLADSHQFAWHLQSYFLVFRKKIVQSPVFEKWIQSIEKQDSKMDYIFKYEIGLSQLLLSSGFQAEVFFRLKKRDFFKRFRIGMANLWTDLKLNQHAARSQIRSQPKKLYHDYMNLNVSQYFWKEFIRRKVPAIKIEIFRENPKNQPLDKILELLQSETSYPIDLISKHLKTSRQEKTNENK